MENKLNAVKGFSLFLAGTLALAVAGCASKQAVKEEPTPEPVKEEVKKALSFDVAYFEYNQATLRSDAKAILKSAVEIILANPEAKINVDGHCDERGTDEYNMDLGWKRAYAVRDYLKRLGIPEKQLYPASYGRSRPAVVGNDESAWSKNRRVELSERK